MHLLLLMTLFPYYGVQPRKLASRRKMRCGHHGSSRSPYTRELPPCRFCESGKHTGHRLKEQDFEMTLRLLERSLHVEAHQKTAPINFGGS